MSDTHGYSTDQEYSTGTDPPSGSGEERQQLKATPTRSVPDSGDYLSARESPDGGRPGARRLLHEEAAQPQVVEDVPEQSGYDSDNEKEEEEEEEEQGRWEYDEPDCPDEEEEEDDDSDWDDEGDDRCNYDTMHGDENAEPRIVPNDEYLAKLGIEPVDLYSQENKMLEAQATMLGVAFCKGSDLSQGMQPYDLENTFREVTNMLHQGEDSTLEAFMEAVLDNPERLYVCKQDKRSFFKDPIFSKILKFNEGADTFLPIFPTGYLEQLHKDIQRATEIKAQKKAAKQESKERVQEDPTIKLSHMIACNFVVEMLVRVGNEHCLHEISWDLFRAGFDKMREPGSLCHETYQKYKEQLKLDNFERLNSETNRGLFGRKSAVKWLSNPVFETKIGYINPNISGEATAGQIKVFLKKSELYTKEQLEKIETETLVLLAQRNKPSTSAPRGEMPWERKKREAQAKEAAQREERQKTFQKVELSRADEEVYKPKDNSLSFGRVAKQTDTAPEEQQAGSNLSDTSEEVEKPQRVQFEKENTVVEPGFFGRTVEKRRDSPPKEQPARTSPSPPPSQPETVPVLEEKKPASTTTEMPRSESPPAAPRKKEKNFTDDEDEDEEPQRAESRSSGDDEEPAAPSRLALTQYRHQQVDLERRNPSPSFYCEEQKGHHRLNFWETMAPLENFEQKEGANYSAGGERLRQFAKGESQEKKALQKAPEPVGPPQPRRPPPSLYTRGSASENAFQRPQMPNEQHPIHERDQEKQREKIRQEKDREEQRRKAERDEAARQEQARLEKERLEEQMRLDEMRAREEREKREEERKRIVEMRAREERKRKEEEKKRLDEIRAREEKEAEEQRRLDKEIEYEERRRAEEQQHRDRSRGFQSNPQRQPDSGRNFQQGTSPSLGSAFQPINPSHDQSRLSNNRFSGPTIPVPRYNHGFEIIDRSEVTWGHRRHEEQEPRGFPTSYRRDVPATPVHTETFGGNDGRPPYGFGRDNERLRTGPSSSRYQERDAPRHHQSSASLVYSRPGSSASRFEPRDQRQGNGQRMNPSRAEMQAFVANDAVIEAEVRAAWTTPGRLEPRDQFMLFLSNYVYAYRDSPERMRQWSNIAGNLAQPLDRPEYIFESDAWWEDVQRENGNILYTRKKNGEIIFSWDEDESS